MCDIRTVSIAGALKTMTKSPLKLVAPATVNRTVTMPRRKPNSVYRTREHLTAAEVDRLIDAAKANRWGHRDAAMILVAYRHGLRSSELVDLRWDQIDFNHATLHVRRAKKGTPATHPIVGDEMRALRKLQREQDPKSPFVFTSERGSPFTTAGFARMVERAGVEAKLGFPALDLEGGVSVGAADIRLPRTFMCEAARWTSARRGRWRSRCGSPSGWRTG